MNRIVIAHLVVGVLNAIAACACLTVAGMNYVNIGECDLVNILLGSINFLCAVYNITWACTV